MIAKTLGVAVSDFLKSHKPRTAESYSYVLNNMARYVGEGKLLTEVTDSHMLDYKVSLDHRPIRDRTFNKYIKDTKAFFNWCVKQKHLDVSPAAVLKTRKTETQVPREKAMSEENVALLLDYARWRKRDLALLLFFMDTGCRAGGAAALKWPDIDFAANEAQVTEKGNKSRTVWFGDSCNHALRDWQRHQPKKAGVYVFSSSIKPMLVASLSHVIQKMCIAVGIPPQGAHSLRHRKGYQLADARIAPSVAATALGHTSIMTTLTHYFPADEERAKKAMVELSSAPKTVTAEKTKVLRFPKSG